MTATPRALSDAVQADYEELISERADESAAIDRWTLTRTIAQWVTLGILFALFGILSVSLWAGSLAVFLIFVVLSLAAPVLLIPAAIVWVLAVSTVARLEARRGQAMFTLYGITIDRTVTPPVYAVTVPAAWINPSLHRTRALLGDTAASADVL